MMENEKRRKWTLDMKNIQQSRKRLLQSDDKKSSGSQYFFHYNLQAPGWLNKFCLLLLTVDKAHKICWKRKDKRTVH